MYYIIIPKHIWTIQLTLISSHSLNIYSKSNRFIAATDPTSSFIPTPSPKKKQRVEGNIITPEKDAKNANEAQRNCAVNV